MNDSQRDAEHEPRHDAPLVAWVEGIGVRGPGLCGWLATRDVLAGRASYQPAPTALVAPPLLPPAERRRVGKGVKVALEVGLEACAHSGRDAATLASVFASSSGDGDNCDAICRALATDRLISPTRFHNSVHNAPSGYWGIAAQSNAPSTSLCAFDASFAAGLMDAATQIACGADAVLLVAYDAPYPEPLHTARPTPDAFGVALVLARERGTKAIARIEIASSAASASSITKASTRMDDEALEACRTAIPAARALPLLAALARARETAHETANREVVLEDVNRDVNRDVNCSGLALIVRAVESTRQPDHEGPHPMRLSRKEISERIPHAGRMVLLDEVVEWDDEHIVCRSGTHQDRGNPLYLAGQLSSVCAIEYAAQAMAVHGSLLAHRDDAASRPRAGFLASVRNVRMEVVRLDDVHGALTIEAMRDSGDDARVLYNFEVRSGERVLVSGRAAVVLDAEGLTADPTEGPIA